MEANIRLAKRETKRMNMNRKKNERKEKEKKIDWVAHSFIANLKKEKSGGELKKTLKSVKEKAMKR